jgi:putative SbcD/Mre11-related phosphoesterase
VLTPEGGLILPRARTAVIADVHLGYEWARASAGDCLPAHSLAETLERLERLCARGRIERLVVAGDLVEQGRPCRRTASDVGRLCRWLGDRGIHTHLLLGNHDRSLRWMIDQIVVPDDAARPVLEDQLMLNTWAVTHGHRDGAAGKTVCGHHHPAVRVLGRSAPCFLVGDDRIVLPAFSQNAAGLDVASAALPAGWDRAALRCLLSTGAEVLDFGPLAGLAARLRA